MNSQNAKPSHAPASPSQQAQSAQIHHDTSQQKNNVSSPSSATNQNTECKRISCEDIQLVQNLIERCLQLYMNKSEVMNTLLNQAKIEPGFTSLVWQKLEEQNPEFFKAYYIRLKLKRHIMTFNHLLEQQVHLMQKMRIIPTKVQPLANGMHSMGQVPMGFPVPGIPAPSLQVLPQSPAVSSGSPLENFHPSHENNAMDSIIPAGDITGNATSFPFADISEFVSNEANSHEHNSFGEDGNNSALGHLPRNFSLSDLAAELGATSDLGALGNYTSPFMSPEAETFLQSPQKHDIGCVVFEEDDKLLDDLDFGDLK